MPGAANLRDCKILENIMNKQATDGRLYAAVCASPAVALGSWGLLKGLKVNSQGFSYYSVSKLERLMNCLCNNNWICCNGALVYVRQLVTRRLWNN